MRNLILVFATLAVACSGDPTTPPARSSRDQGDENRSERGPGLIWPIACVPEDTCEPIGHADVDRDNKAFDCSTPHIAAHEGTDIPISDARAAAGIDVYAAADGEVLWVFDGRFDACPNATEPQCQNPTDPPNPGDSAGTVVCTELGPYCPEGRGQCYWCFAGGNVVVIRHRNTPGVFATRYDHFRKNSILVKRGDTVKAGDKLGLVGSAGNSTQPHLHFEVWGQTYYDPVEPFAGECGPNKDKPLWAHDPPWSK